jgi:nicotinate phosphoribosyltransferase
VAKASANKASVGGRKAAARRYGRDGHAIEEIMVTGPDTAVAEWTPQSDDLRPLLAPMVVDGAVDSRWVGPYGVSNAAINHGMVRAELPRSARRLSDGDPAIPTVDLRLDDLHY